MLSKIFFRRIVLFVLVVSLTLAITACNRKDDGVSPSLTSPTMVPKSLSTPPRALIENATGAVNLNPPPENPLSPDQNIAQIASSSALLKFAGRGAIHPLVAPNPTGENLAYSAFPSASSIWPWPLYGFPFTPDRAINGITSDWWSSIFWEWTSWYRLDWPQPVNIGRIFIYQEVVSHVMQTVQHIDYFDTSTNSWKTIPGSVNLHFNGGAPPLNFIFDPITTTGIIVYMNTGPVNPHPNLCVMIGEIEVYGPAASLKIISPTTETVFSSGEDITFTGEKKGSVTNIQWSSNLDGIIGSNFPTIHKSDLRIGTHTITLSGAVGGPVASILGSSSASIRAQSLGDTVSDSITIGITGGKPRVTKIEFQSMTAQTNLNKIYDRKGDFRKSTYLGPIQWQGKIVDNEIVQELCYPVSYVRSNATSLSNGPSKLKILATFKDLGKAPSLNFTVNLTAKCKGNGIEKNLTFSPVAVSTSNDLETSKEFESIEGLPDVVGIWDLELSWSFVSNGANLGDQQTPQIGAQKLYTTWEKPLITGEFGVNFPPNSDGTRVCVEMPTYYLEILNFSCYFLRDFGSGKTTDELMTRNLVATYDRIAGLGYRYSTIIPVPGVTRRGLDRLLDDTLKDGWCMEWGHLYKALTEAHGVNVWSVVGQLKPMYYLKDALIADGIKYVAIGGTKSTTINPPDPTRIIWAFGNHHYIVKSADSSSFDPTFSLIGPTFPSYFEDMFDYGNLETKTIDPNVLNYVDFAFSN